MIKRHFSRRDFLKVSAAAGAGLALGSAPRFIARAQDEVTLRLMAWGNPTEFEAREATLAMFEELHPNIKVDFLHTPDEYATKLQTMLAGGDYPDIIFLGNGDIAPYVERGQLLDLTPFIEAENFDTSDIFPMNLSLYNIDGKQYGFPIDAPSQQLFYNKSIFEEVGIEPPSSDWEDASWNWESFLEKAIAVTDKDNNRWGFQINTGFRAWWIWITANDGSFFNEEGTECVINEPASVEALQFLADLIHVHEVAPPLDVASEMGGSTLFETGVTAMETWPPFIGYMRTNIADKFVWDVSPHPAGAAGKSCSGGGTGHTISAFTENPEASWEFMKFVVSTEFVTRWTEVMGIVPPLKSVAESETFLTPGQPPEHINVFTQASPYLRPDPIHSSFIQARTIAQTELERLWLGESDAQEVTDEIVRQVNRLL